MPVACCTIASPHRLPTDPQVLDRYEQLIEHTRLAGRAGEAFNLVRIQGLTHPDAAEVLGVSIKTVQRRLNRARILLAERLADLRPDSSTSGGPVGDTPGP